jgi:hypothetical protein
MDSRCRRISYAVCLRFLRTDCVTALSHDYVQTIQGVELAASRPPIFGPLALAPSEGISSDSLGAQLDLIAAIEREGRVNSNEQR